MNLGKLAKPMTELAGAIARKHDLEAAGIVVVKDKKICVIMSGGEEMKPERKVKILESLAKYLARMAEAMKSGDCEVKEVETEGLEDKINQETKKHDDPGKGQFFPN